MVEKNEEDNAKPATKILNASLQHGDIEESARSNGIKQNIILILI